MKSRRGSFVCKSLLFAVVVVAAGLSEGKTIGWWRMEGTVGEAAATVPNAANPGVLSAVWNNSGTASKYSETFAPPVAGTSENLSAASITASSNVHSSRFEVTDDGDHSLRPASFTLETFYRWDTTKSLASDASAGVVGYIRDNTVSCSYGIAFKGNNVLAKFYDGAEKTITSSGFNPKDGKWHHLAITFDDETKTAELWIDYKSYGTKVLSGNLVYAAKPFCIGCFGGRGMMGWIDEVRLSDSVLSVAEFLDARLPARYLLDVAEPAETVFRFRLGDEVSFPAAYVGAETTCGWCKALPSAANVNLANWTTGSLELTGTAPALGEGDTPGLRILVSEGKTNDFADVKYSTFDGAGAYRFQQGSKDQIRGGDFTAELFMRTSSSQSNTGLLRQLMDTGNETDVSWQIGLRDTGALVFSMFSGTPNVYHYFPFGTDYADGLWHHLAAVYRVATTNVTLYYDGHLVRSVTLPKLLADVNGGVKVLIGRRSGGFAGDIDEVRITQRALDPSEFLSVPTQQIHYGFNGSWEPAAVGETEARQATHSAYTGGSDPSFSAEGLAGRYLYSCRTNQTADTFLSTNTQHVSIYKGQVVMLSETNGHLRATRSTTEAFVRFPARSGLTQYADVLALSDGSARIWTVRVDSGNRLYVLFNGTSSVFHPASGAKALNDGQWHHLALTLKESDVSSNTDVELFVDYESYVSATVGVNIPYSTGKKALQLRASSNNDDKFQRFDLDEVRYTTSLKEPGDFIGFGRYFVRRGLILVVQ